MAELARVAVLCDVHANLPALEAVLAEVEREDVDLIVSGGDVVLGPMPAEVVDRLVGLGDRVAFVNGNCDRQIVEAYDSGSQDPMERFNAERLDQRQRDFLASFEQTVSLEIAGLGPVVFCHGTPRSDREVMTSVSTEERLAEILTGVAEPTIVGGHTHVRYDRRAAGKRIVNAGSVGLAYQGEPGAYWALMGPDVELRKTPLDPQAVHEALSRSGCPGLDEFLKESLLEPAAPADVEQYFESRAAG